MFLARETRKRRHCGLKTVEEYLGFFLLFFLLLLCLKSSPSDMQLHTEQKVTLQQKPCLSSQKSRKRSPGIHRVWEKSWSTKGWRNGFHNSVYKQIQVPGLPSTCACLGQTSLAKTLRTELQFNLLSKSQCSMQRRDEKQCSEYLEK